MGFVKFIEKLFSPKKEDIKGNKKSKVDHPSADSIPTSVSNSCDSNDGGGSCDCDCDGD